MSDEDRRHTASEPLSLHAAAELLLEECRMVLPGLQALFGFQLIVVFSDGFGERLTSGEQRLHLGAIALVMIAAAVIMTPAAIHRRSGARSVSESFIRISTRLLLTGMMPLALALSIDFYLLARVILGSRPVACGLASAVFIIFTGLWYLFPRPRGERGREPH